MPRLFYACMIENNNKGSDRGMVSSFVLFTDYGLEGPYVGQLHAVCRAVAPSRPIIDLMHDAPAFDPLRAGIVLRQCLGYMPVGSMCVAVVDPGVGTERQGLLARAGERWLVGPDNGLLAAWLHRHPPEELWRLRPPSEAPATFHGRDMFAPAAAAVAQGERDPWIEGPVTSWVGMGQEHGYDGVIYVDHFGNAWTGMVHDPERHGTDWRLCINGHSLPYARTFAEAEGCFWHVNANGLVEICANQASAKVLLDIKLGDQVSWQV